MPEPQNYANHVRLNPLYHFATSFPLLANFFWAIYRIFREVTGAGLTGDSVIALILAIGLLTMFLSVRAQVLTVQDRVIRLEMRLRLARLLPAGVQARVASLTTRQLVALRFAGDAELPALVDEVLAGTGATPKEIKMRIRDWQADYQRA